jgi:hypothetical protein
VAAVPPGEVEPGQLALLRARQGELVAALVAGAEPPAGLDRDRVRVQAAAMLRKRGRSVAHAQPDLAAALGTEFGRAFADYALGQVGRAGAPPDCAAADAVEFARYLRGAGRRPHPSADVRREARRVTRPWLARLGYRFRR